MAIFGRSFPIRGRLLQQFSLFPTGIYTLTANTGSYSLAGVAQNFTTKEVPATGSYALTGVPASFTDSLAPAAGSYALTGVAVTFTTREAPTSGSYALTGAPASDTITEAPAPGAYALTGQAALYGATELTVSGSYAITGQATTDSIVMLAAGGSYAWTLTPIAVYTLTRSGGDDDQVDGGIGHYLVEREEKRRLAAITRKAPRPIDRTTAPRFRPLATPHFMSSSTPAIDRAAVADLQKAEGEAAAQRAAIARQRRQEAEILLLAC